MMFAKFSKQALKKVGSFLYAGIHYENGWFWKVLTAFIAFYAFCFHVRQEDKKDFDHWKPQFVIRTMKDSAGFYLANRNKEPLYFKGFSDPQHYIDSTPAKYVALPYTEDTVSSIFGVRLNRSNADKELTSYWSDGNLNIYELKIKREGGQFYFAGLPNACRVDGAQSLYLSPEVNVSNSDRQPCRTGDLFGSKSEDGFWGAINRFGNFAIKGLARSEWFTLDSIPDDDSLYPEKK